MFVCLYPINVKTVEPIEAKIYEAIHMTPRKDNRHFFPGKNVETYYFENSLLYTEKSAKNNLNSIFHTVKP